MRSALHLTGRRIVWCVGAFVVVAVLVWVLAFSSLLGAKHIQVRGTSTLSAADVRAAAGIGTGSPLLRLDTDAVAGRVEKLADVAQATVHTSLPSTVTITVSERVAVGYVTASVGFVLVDKTGRQFRPVATAPAGLPKFDIPFVAQTDGGQTLGVQTAGGGADATGRAVSTVAAALPGEIRAKLTSISADRPDVITLELADGRSVRWGSSDQSPAKAALLPTLLARPGSVFDVSDPTQVFSN